MQKYEKHTVSLGQLNNLLSSTTVPTTTTIRDFLSAILFIYRAMELIDKAGRLIRDIKRRLNTILLK